MNIQKASKVFLGLLLFFLIFVLNCMSPCWSHCKYFLLFCTLSFHFIYDFCCCAKAFEFNWVPFVYFCLYFHYWRRLIQKKDCCYSCQSVLPMFSSRSFMVSGLIFRFLIHFEFILYYLLYMMLECSNYYIPLHVANPVFPAPLIKETIFSPLYIIASFVVD